MGLEEWVGFLYLYVNDHIYYNCHLHVYVFLSTKVINSLDSNLEDLLAVPSLHFNWLAVNGGFHQHMLSYRTGNYGWRHFVGGHIPFQT